MSLMPFAFEVLFVLEVELVALPFCSSESRIAAASRCRFTDASYPASCRYSASNASLLLSPSVKLHMLPVITTSSMFYAFYHLSTFAVPSTAGFVNSSKGFFVIASYGLYTCRTYTTWFLTIYAVHSCCVLLNLGE